MTGLSWSGHNIFGERESIEAVKRAIHAEEIVPQLKDEIMRLQVRLAATTFTKDNQ